jgi:hypothetical protein
MPRATAEKYDFGSAVSYATTSPPDRAKKQMANGRGPAPINSNHRTNNGIDLALQELASKPQAA